MNNMKNISREQTLLAVGITIPVFYFLSFIILGALSPNYSQISNYVSDLGKAEMPYNNIFNIILILMGILYFFSGTGYYFSVKRNTGKNVLAIFIGIFVAIMGGAFIFGGIYPLPDPRHAGFGTGLLHFLSPPLLARAFWNMPFSRIFTRSQLLFFALFVLIMVVPESEDGFLNESNSGLVQRISALILYIWFSFSSYWLIKYKTKKTA